MNLSEFSELRRRLTAEKNNVSCIRGCYVDKRGEILSTFTEHPISMPREELEKYLSIFKRVLSGTPGRNLNRIDLDPAFAAGLQSHRDLNAMRLSALRDAEAADSFVTSVISSLKSEENYLILLMHDVFDVPFRGSDGSTQEDASDTSFSYLICAVCPVKLTKPELSLRVGEKGFHLHGEDRVAGAPDLGFLFPAFDDRTTNLYSVVCYDRDVKEPHTDLKEALFGEMPMTASEQEDTFRTVLEDALEDDLSYEVVRSVDETLRGMLEEQKKDKQAEVLTLGKRDVSRMLESCGVTDDRVEAFEEAFDERFGEVADVGAANLLGPKQFRVRTPDVTVNVDPAHSDLIETRVIDGIRYILIRADEGVEVNGMNIRI